MIIKSTYDILTNGGFQGTGRSMTVQERQKTATIMVVEDTAIAREPLVRLLQYEGYRAVGVTNGQEAIDALPIHNPDIILLDILMPVMNGLEFLSMIRSDRRLSRWRDMPVIVLTAVRDEICERDVRNLGVQGFVLKTGFSLEELMAMIRAQIAA
jgi:CheY-like chemotaxis protein